jgi:hypothetical protein
MRTELLTDETMLAAAGMNRLCLVAFFLKDEYPPTADK